MTGPGEEDGRADGPREDHDVGRPEGHDQQGAAPGVTGVAIAAMLGGVVASWVLMAILVVGTNSGVVGWYVAGAVTLALVAFLVPRRTRQTATGAWIGFAVGVIVGAGTCAGLVGTGPVIG